jgi:hypothetical protein
MCSCAHLEQKRRNVSEQDVFEQTLYRTVQHTLLVMFYVIKQKENQSVFSYLAKLWADFNKVSYWISSEKRVELLNKFMNIGSIEIIGYTQYDEIFKLL